MPTDYPVPPPRDSLWAVPPVDPHARHQDRPALAGQNNVVLNMLRAGWVTPDDAYRVGVTRLAARCHDLRSAGYEIEDEYVPGSRVKRYRLKQQEQRRSA